MSNSSLSRRSVLGLATAGAAGLMTSGWGGGFSSVVAQENQPRLIVRTEDPVNLEFPYASLNSFITPNDLYYVRSHFPNPEINADAYRLEIDGLVERTLSLSMAELRRLPSRRVTFTMECAGNSRALLNPPGSGVAWQMGAVSTAEWTGVPLSAVLARAGVRANATEVVCIGLDRGRITSQPGPAEQDVHFVRSLPLSTARQDDVLLAYQMNGQDLTPNHGFPLRMVVPGWYGMASVKWLGRLRLTNQPFTGFYQSSRYIRFERVNGSYAAVPITTMPVKSLIATPTANSRVRRNQRVQITGAAWSGEGNIRGVEVSTDGGRTWHAAQLQGEARPNCWRFWAYNWQMPAQAGAVSIMSKATDTAGNTQPRDHDRNRGAYMINHTIPVPITIV